MGGLFNGVVASDHAAARRFGRSGRFFRDPAADPDPVTAAAEGRHPPSAPWPAEFLGDFGFSVVLPLTALIIGTSVLGAEIDDGSIVHLLATPVRRSTVIVTKFAVAAALTMRLRGRARAHRRA